VNTRRRVVIPSSEPLSSASVDGPGDIGHRRLLTLRLPYPPSNNRYYRHAKGRTYLSGDGYAYRIAVLERRPRQGWPMLGRLRMRIEVTPNRGVGIDLDNAPKSICDALQYAGIYYDDSQIDDLQVVRMPKGTQAGVVVTLEEIQKEAA
jgi:crossover junction endodeoxyribonuclease RusA